MFAGGVAMGKHDPRTAEANIIRYNKNDPKEHETIETVRGKSAAVRRLHDLRKEGPDKYAYYWTWADVDAAQGYERAKLLKETQKRRRQHRKLSSQSP
jgi:heme-degrading monooxygenase HmoA